MVCDGAEGPVLASRQEPDGWAIFHKQWASYQAALQHNCLKHKEMLGAVQQYLEQRTQGPLHILDCGAGDSEPIAKAIASSPGLTARVHSYTGVDLTPNAIAIGQRNMAAAVGAHCSVQYVEADMLHYVRTCHERYDMVLASYSVHHLPFEQKREFAAAVAALLRPGGVFLLVDVFLQPGQSREEYLKVYCQQIHEEWDGMSQQQKDDVEAHVTAHDYPVELSDYKAWAAADGTFASVEQLASIATYQALAMQKSAD